MMKKYSLKYGKGTLDFELPAGQVLCEIEARNAEARKNLEGSYRRALDHPIDAPPLKEIIAPDHRVAIIASDITRPVR
jgi:nickel-dependent lactate racemase